MVSTLTGSFELIILKPRASIAAHCLDPFPWYESDAYLRASGVQVHLKGRAGVTGTVRRDVAIAQKQLPRCGPACFEKRASLGNVTGGLSFLGFPKPRRLAFAPTGSMGDERCVSDRLCLLMAAWRHGFPASTGCQELPPCPRGPSSCLTWG